MTPFHTWIAVGLGLFVLWQIVKWWPGEVSEPGTRGGEYPTRTPDAVCPFPNAGPSLSHGGERPYPGSLTSPFDWAAADGGAE